MNVQPIINEVLQASGVTDPATQKLIADVTTDSAALGLRSLAGEDVDHELKHVAAQSLNLEVFVRRMIESQLAMRVTSVLAKALVTVA